MTTLQKKLVVDDKGQPLEVIIPYGQFCDLMEALGLDLDGEAIADLNEARQDWAAGNEDAFTPLAASRWWQGWSFTGGRIAISRAWMRA